MVKNLGGFIVEGRGLKKVEDPWFKAQKFVFKQTTDNKYIFMKPISFKCILFDFSRS